MKIRRISLIGLRTTDPDVFKRTRKNRNDGNYNYFFVNVENALVCCQRINQLIYAGPSAKHESHEFKWKTRGAVTDKTDRRNEVSKMLVKSLGN